MAADAERFRSRSEVPAAGNDSRTAGPLKETKVGAWKGPAWKHYCGHGPWWDERDDWNALGNIFT